MTFYRPLLVSVLYAYKTSDMPHEKYIHVRIRRPGRTA